MSTFVELEIQSLLSAQEDLEQAADKLISSVESSPDNFSPDNITALARFLNRTGLYRKLVDFVLRHLDNESFPTPWPFFLDAVSQTTEPLDNKIIKSLIEGIQEQNAEEEASRTTAFDTKEPLLKEWRRDRKYKIQKGYKENRKRLFEQLVTLRTQQLYEQEKSLLQKLIRLYPGDHEIQREQHEHEQRYALEVLSRRSPKVKALSDEDFTSTDPEIEQAVLALNESLLEHAAADPSMAFDFAIVAYMLDQYETCLEILGHCEESPALLWLRLEVLLKARHFVAVLHELTHVEMEFAHEPETFFATAYIRAQAYWGLGQKHSAVEVMEGLLQSRPHYRAASALLSMWSQQ
ncbi:hypothetical protein [Bdellovibrio sp. HCB2-146]|uniref:hypothetical protein n=1 Tax=Bdellovibrio sp. HCB2-146 TaxID=3394362 RepID=UPI0039BC4B09